MSAKDNKDSSHIAFHQSVNFTFDGVKYKGFKGDTIASALIRNNIKIIGRSFKYHRPRGIYSWSGFRRTKCFSSDCAPAHINEPNTRATVVEQIFDGLNI